MSWSLRMVVLCFLALSRFYNMILDDGLAEWKAFATIGVAEICLLACLTFAGIIAMGHSVALPFGLTPKAAIVIASCILIVPTYRILFSSPELLARCKAEFGRYSDARQTLITIAMPIAFLAFVALAGYLAVTAHRFR
jgi:hypothetical protein